VNSLVSYAAVRAAHRLGIPVVWHIRELFADQKGELHWPTSWARPWIRRVISQSATALVVNSNTVRRNVLGANALGNITVIPNAVPDSFFHYELSKEEARKTLQLPGDVPLVGFPGTLRPVKAHHVLLDAIPKILSAIPDCVFPITGVNDSDYSRDLIKQAQVSEFGDRIVFTGAVADMQAFYRACNVCCIASESESFGRTAVEAFASRTPLVSTTSGGLNDIVNHDVNSLAVDFGSAAQLSRAVVKILEDGSLAACLTKAAFEEANELYSQAKCAQSVTSVIRDVAVASGSHAA
jgi:glycogen(starch) synthase